MPRREDPIPALSAGLSHVMLTGLFLAVASPVPLDPHPVPPAPADAPARSLSPGAPPAVPAFPAVPPGTPAVPDASPVADAGPPPDAWPEDEVVRAKEQCMHQLASTPVEFEWLPPIRDGACGLPAPVRLRRLGSVTFTPAVHVNCRMVTALDTWIRATMQPAARERLKSDVVRIVGASGYSCRNIYNRKNARLSQHALANAIDIAGFALANGRTVRVLTGWGPTERDIKALEAQAKAEAEAKAQAKAEASAKSSAKAKVTAKGDKRTDEAPEKKGAAQAARGPSGGKGEVSASAVSKASLSPPVHLPLARRSVVGTAPGGTRLKRPTSEAQFLRAIHGGACGAFGTVLGPEANDPHRDHFHLDLIPRRTRRGYCE